MADSPAATPTRGGRLDSLTSLRWFAAFGVFLFHMRNIVTFPSQLDWLTGTGYLGVTFFFVLSGFVLTWSWQPGTPVRAFYWRRFARIYPLHLLALLIAVPVFYRAVVPEGQWWIKPFDLGLLLLSVLVIQGWWLAPSVLFSGNPAAWTLTVEAFFYALHPAIVRMMSRMRARGALAAAVLVAAAAFVLRTVTQPSTGGWLGQLPEPIMHLPSFVLGMLVAWACRQGWRLRIGTSIPLLALMAWFLLVAYSGIGWTGPYVSEVTAVLCALVIAAAATSDTAGRRGILTWRPLVALGEWSFAFYLIHATLIYLALEIFGVQQHSYSRMLVWSAVLLSTSIIAAWLMHRFIERPLERRLRAWQDRRLARRKPAEPTEPAEPASV